MKPWKNNYYTTTNQAHDCRYCGERIPAGSEVRTVNPRNEPRFWVCSECDSLLRQIANGLDERNHIAFGDDGAWLVNDEYLDKAFCTFAVRCTDETVVQQLEDDIRGRNR